MHASAAFEGLPLQTSIHPGLFGRRMSLECAAYKAECLQFLSSHILSPLLSGCEVFNDYVSFLLSPTRYLAGIRYSGHGRKTSQRSFTRF